VPLFVRHTPVAAPRQALADWHFRPGVLQRLTPPWDPTTVERTEGIAEGSRAVLRVGIGAARMRMVAEHFDVHPGERFSDRQIEGPFAEWTHEHRFEDAGPGHSVLSDQIRYGLPLGPVADSVAGGAVAARLERTFAYRHRVTAADVARHAAADLAPMTVAITGSTGLLGEALAAFLLSGGHRVVRLVRDRRAAARTQKRPGERLVYWNVEAGEVDLDRLGRAVPDAVVHLAGASVYGAPTAAHRRRVWESRVKGTLLLSRALTRLDRPPRVLLSASATGYYGDRGAVRLPEDAGPGTGFLPDLCQAWEAATAEAEAAGIRVAHPRIGVVLSPGGGALGALAPLARLGLGGWPGRGDSFVPWIALDDVLYALHHLIAHDDARGAYNLSAPEPVEMKALVKTLGHVLGRPTPLRVPDVLVRTVGGRLIREALASARVVPDRLLAEGFTFTYPALEPALRHLVGRDAPTA